MNYPKRNKLISVYQIEQMKRPVRGKPSRTVQLDKYVKASEIIDEDMLFKMFFSNIDKVLERYTKKTGTQFEYVGNGKYVVL
jgi:hypothetical protein